MAKASFTNMSVFYMPVANQPYLLLKANFSKRVGLKWANNNPVAIVGYSTGSPLELKNMFQLVPGEKETQDVVVSGEEIWVQTDTPGASFLYAEATLQD